MFKVEQCHFLDFVNSENVICFAELLYWKNTNMKIQKNE